MVFNRISLIDAHEALDVVEANEGKLTQILFNRTAHYGTKTVTRFKTISELENYIETVYPLQIFDPNCECGLCDESIWQLLSFTVQLPDNRYVTFINNLRGEFESADATRINVTSKAALAKVFKKNERLFFLKDNFSCFGYIHNQNRYVNPCEYVELIKNDFFDELMAIYAKTRKHTKFTNKEIFVDRCYDVALDEKKDIDWPLDIGGELETTTTIAAPTTTTTTTEAPQNEGSGVGSGSEETTTTTTTIPPGMNPNSGDVR